MSRANDEMRAAVHDIVLASRGTKENILRREHDARISLSNAVHAMVEESLEIHNLKATTNPHPCDELVVSEYVDKAKVGLGKIPYLPTHDHGPGEECSDSCPVTQWEDHTNAYGNPYQAAQQAVEKVANDQERLAYTDMEEQRDEALHALLLLAQAKGDVDEPPTSVSDFEQRQAWRTARALLRRHSLDPMEDA